MWAKVFEGVVKLGVRRWHESGYWAVLNSRTRVLMKVRGETKDRRTQNRVRWEQDDMTPGQ
jgi:hypothetical protein